MKKSSSIILLCSIIIVLGAVFASIITLISVGAIDGEKNTLVISSGSSLATYNGEALTDQSWKIESGELKEGHYLKVDITGSQTGAGVSENFLSVKVLNDEGKNVTSQYNISLRPGTLNVKHRYIGVIADSGIKMYDGEPLTANGYTLDSPLSLVSGHKIEVKVEGTITEIGEQANHILSVIIKDAEGNDVSRNYNIEGTDGKLIVHGPEDLVFKSESAKKQYDGTPLIENNWELVSGDLVSGDRVEVTMRGSQTDVGTSKNEFDVKILRTKNDVTEDVTHLYNVSCMEGNLTVSKRSVTFESASAQKRYDGDPLFKHEYTSVYDEVLNSFDITPTFEGERTEPGSTENLFTVVITDKEGVDRTDFFDITYKYGILKVVDADEELKIEVEFESGSNKKLYDGTPLTSSAVQLVCGELEEGHVPKFDVTGTITDVGTVDNTFEVLIFDDAGNDVTEKYLITKTLGKLEIEPAKVTIKSASDEKAYDGTALTNGTFTTSPSYLAEKFIFDVIIIGSQTDIGKTPNTISAYTVYDTEGNNVTKNFVITTEEGTLSVVAKEDLKPKLTVSSGTYSKEYDGLPLEFDRENYSVTGELKEGHSAIVALPTEITEIGIVDNEIVISIIDDATGEDVTGEYLITSEPGTLTVSKRAINLVASGAIKEYDGTALESPDVYYDTSLLLPGHVLTAAATGRIVEIGTTENIVTEYLILDELGNDVTYYYEISTQNGVLEITARTLNIITGTLSKKYDETPLTCDRFTYDNDALLEGHVLDIKINGTITDPGTVENTVEYTKVLENGEDVSHYYNFNVIFGTLTVFNELEQVKIVFYSLDAEKVYDGQPLTKHEYRLADGYMLKSGHRALVEFLGSQTEVGKSPNEFNVTIYDAHGTDVSGEYDISKEMGTLSVTPASLTVISNSAEKIYDGSALECHEYSYSPLYDWCYLEVNIIGSQTIVGSSDNVIDYVEVYSSETGERITNNFQITKRLGTLTVHEPEEERDEIEITSSDESKTYDGTPIYGSYTVSGEVKDGDTLIVTMPEGGYTDAGVYENSFDYAIFDSEGNDVTGEYLVNISFGTVNIDKRPLEIETATDSKVYDGIPLENSNFEISADQGGLAEGHGLGLTIDGVVHGVGSVSNSVSEIAITDSLGNDVSSNYEVSITTGTLTVEKAPINVTAGSAEKLFDGKPLESEEIIVDGELATGHSINVTVSGSITNPGTEENSITDVKITDAEGADVSEFYEIKTDDGILTVHPADSSSDTEMTDPIAPDDYEELKNQIIYTVNSTAGGRIYLKQSSYGSFGGKSWSFDVPGYTELTVDGVSVFYLPAYALSNSGASVSELTIIPNGNAPYVLPYYTNYSTSPLQENDIVVVGDSGEGYIVYYYARDYEDGASVADAVLNFEAHYSEFVHENYLAIDEETLEFMAGIIESEGFDKSDSEIIAKVAEFISTKHAYNLNYNPLLADADNVAIAFLRDYKEGVCTHYATAATLLFRALGIPARYTVGFVVNTEANEDTNVSAAMAHAWVEVYIDGFGWINVEVTGAAPNTDGGDNPEEDPTDSGMLSGYVGGPLTEEEKNDVYFTVKSGQAGAPWLKVQSFGNYDPLTNTWSNAVEYSATIGNYSPYYIASLSYENSHGNLESVGSTWIDIAPNKEYLSIPYYSRTGFALQNISDSRVVLNYPGESYRFSYYLAQDPDEFSSVPASEYTSDIEAYTAFVYENYLYVDNSTKEYMQRIIDENGWSPSDDIGILIYEISKYIKLAADYDVEYNKDMDSEENPIISFLDNYQYGSHNYFASAATLLFRTIGIPARYTLGFETDIKKSGVAYDVKGSDLRAWVEVYIDGCGWVYVDTTAYSGEIKLKITPVDTLGKYNNGTLSPLQEIKGFEALEESPYDISGYYFEVKIEGDNSWLGKVESHITSFKIYNNRNRLVYDMNDPTVDAKNRYNIEFGTGFVHQYLDKLTFGSSSSTKIYDGIAPTFTNADCFIKSGALASGYTYGFVVTANITANAGSHKNSFEVIITKDGVNSTDHYLIAYEYGTSKVERKALMVTAGTATQVYDTNNPQPLICNEILYDMNELVQGDTITSFVVEGLNGQQILPGYRDNVVKSVTITNENGVNVTANYQITYKVGLLTVLPPNS